MVVAQNPPLTVETLREAAAALSGLESGRPERELFGVTDGKRIGTYFERKFGAYLTERYEYDVGNAAHGIDFPGLHVDMKVTSINQPQSSCPFRVARQKIYGLGYSLLVFVYDKQDDQNARTGQLDILHVIFVDAPLTGDYQTTTGVRRILANEGNVDDLIAFLYEHKLPLDDIQMNLMAEELMENPPDVGYLTISNALQWRLQYRRVIDQAGQVAGIHRVR